MKMPTLHGYQSVFVLIRILTLGQIAESLEGLDVETKMGPKLS